MATNNQMIGGFLVFIGMALAIVSLIIDWQGCGWPWYASLILCALLALLSLCVVFIGACQKYSNNLQIFIGVSAVAALLAWGFLTFNFWICPSNSGVNWNGMNSRPQWLSLGAFVAIVIAIFL
mmetsp:Transcript_34705/g.42798  ORF Transcript_34705/g.42798 Transcript_34705/m.42798 type:complete len:123 (-) Transcript_34705:115-483(-)